MCVLYYVSSLIAIDASGVCESKKNALLLPNIKGMPSLLFANSFTRSLLQQCMINNCQIKMILF